jgi:hypothetical protein
MPDEITPVGYSAQVELFLHVDGVAHCATHVCEDYVILETAAELKPGPAAVEVIVDGKSFRSGAHITGAAVDHRRIDLTRDSIPTASRIAS